MIYIVEDDAAIRELEQYALQSSGYDVQSHECRRAGAGHPGRHASR